MSDFISKFNSRKFLISLAAFLGSLGAGITGLATGNETVALAGGILMVISAAIYAACEAYVDGKSAASTSVSLSVDAKPTKVDDAERLINTVIQSDDSCSTASNKEATKSEKAPVTAED